MSIVRNQRGEIFDAPTLMMVTLACGQCGVLFAVTKRFDDARREDQGNFYCPNGHCRAYVESTEARLRKELQQAKANAQYYEQRAQAEQDAAKYLRRSRDAYKGKVTAIKRRVSNGVCPCCNRTFQNLARHMESKHPEWKGDEA